MEHSTTVKEQGPSSKGQGSSSATENTAGCCVVLTTPETHTVGLTSDPAFTSSRSSQENDILTGGRIEDDASSNCPADNTDDDDARGCYKTIIKKRRTRKMNTHKETKLSESIPGVCQCNIRKQSLTAKDREDIIVRLRPLQYLAIFSTPQSHVSDALYRVREPETWRLLERVGLSSPEEQDHETSPLTESTMRRLVVYPLPKNMGPGESEGRRAARARALLLQHQNDEGAVYVDVAKVKNKDAYVAAAVAATTGKIVTSCSVRTRSASQAEEMAIALAARSPGVRTILSDSKTAIRSFSRGAKPGASMKYLKLFPSCAETAFGSLTAHRILLFRAALRTIRRNRYNIDTSCILVAGSSGGTANGRLIVTLLFCRYQETCCIGEVSQGFPKLR
ncbi:hypothetical protein MRX96_026395 [Rhipicephalus microplus]